MRTAQPRRRLQWMVVAVAALLTPLCVQAPAGWKTPVPLTETNVVLTGSGSVSTTFCASLGPLLTTVMV